MSSHAMLTIISNRTTDRHALSQRVIRNNSEDNAAIIRKMMFENSRSWSGYVCAFIHSTRLSVLCLWTHDDVTLVRRTRVYVNAYHHIHIQLPPAIFPDWAWPGFLLPCFLLCIPNYGGEFLGMDDSNCLVRLNFELKSGYLAIATIYRSSSSSQSALHSAPLRSDRSTRGNEKSIPLFIFHAQFSSEKRLNI